MLVCLAEDDPFFQSVIKELVCGAGYEFSGVRSCRELYAMKEVPDLYILDINLPDGNGTDLCREIRRVSHTPVLFLTVKDTDADIVEGFAAGADDYITKPFVPAVFRARVSALLRRSAWNGCSEKHFMSGDLKIDLQDHRLFKGENEVPLFPLEWKLLTALIKRNGLLVLREDLLSSFWDSREAYVNDNTLSVHISRLRKKLGRFEGRSYIKTEASFGYRWNVEIKSYE